jgi:hypothetical protein
MGAHQWRVAYKLETRDKRVCLRGQEAHLDVSTMWVLRRVEVQTRTISHQQNRQFCSENILYNHKLCQMFRHP